MKHIALFTLLLVPALLTSCGKKDKAAGGPPPGAWPANCVVAPATTQEIDDEVLLVATLAAKDSVKLVSELDAAITDIKVREGQAVKKDAVLFQLDDVQTKAHLEEAKASFTLAETTYTRNKQLLAQQTISQQEYDQAYADFLSRKAALVIAEDDVKKTAIRAPFDGVFGEKMVSNGQYVTRGQAVGGLIQVDPLEIVIDVPERHLGRLKKGLHARFTSDAITGEAISGKVVYVAPQVNERTRTVRVKAEVANTNGALTPGMYGKAALVLEKNPSALFIPEAAIIFKGQGLIVFTVSPEGISGIAPVTVGRRIKGKAEILSGLKAGDHVVVEGHQKMGPGMQVIASKESAAYGVTPGPLFSAEAPPATPAAEPAPEPTSDETTDVKEPS